MNILVLSHKDYSKTYDLESLRTLKIFVKFKAKMMLNASYVSRFKSIKYFHSFLKF